MEETEAHHRLGEVEVITRALEAASRRQERVMIFIDGPNLYTTLKQLRQKIDYFKLVRELAKGRKVIRTYVYVTYNPENREEKHKMEGFARALEENGSFCVKTIPKRPRFVNEGGRQRKIWVEKGADVALVTDMLTLAFNNAYDTAILVSGDTDFVKAIEAVQARGKRVEVARFTHATSAELKRTADAFMPLEYLLDKVKL